MLLILVLERVSQLKQFVFADVTECDGEGIRFWAKNGYMINECFLACLLNVTTFGLFQSDLLEEARLMAELNNHYIVSMIGVCREHDIMLVLELAPLGPLNKYLRKSQWVCRQSIWSVRIHSAKVDNCRTHYAFSHDTRIMHRFDHSSMFKHNIFPCPLAVEPDFQVRMTWLVFSSADGFLFHSWWCGLYDL